jgi:DNA modification methylase/rubredoxin
MAIFTNRLHGSHNGVFCMTDNYEQDHLIREEGPTYSAEENAEKERYRQLLREKLRDPGFHQIEGFPIGDDEAILALSDPPYYTACPNPFLGEIIEKWEKERREQRAENSVQKSGTTLHSPLSAHYHREPFAADVSEGKNDPIYNAHSYHTKVPHKAIMRYILHYTQPGDIVLDGFCGTGMTGVAAQLCGDRKTVESLGYRVDEGEQVLDEKGKVFSQLGSRKAVLVDLSPAATFIAYNYNTPVDTRLFEQEAKRILKEVEKECGWMYETIHTDGKTKGKIDFTVWSDVYTCPSCGGEMIFWDAAVDQEANGIRSEWECPHCQALLSKNPRKDSSTLHAERSFETIFDRALGQTIRQAKLIPVLINYSVGKKRYKKRPDNFDLALIKKIEESEIPYPFPTQPMMFKGVAWGDTWRAGVHAGLTHIHHFYPRRSLMLMATLWKKIISTKNIRVSAMLRFLWQSLALGYTRLNRYGATHYSQVNRVLSGTLYVASLTSEVSLNYAFGGKLSRLIKAFSSINLPQNNACMYASSSTQLGLDDSTLDYIFVDPPFGSNLMYSELNFFWEAWLDVFTKNQQEAIVNVTQSKAMPEYQSLMEACFHEFYRTLKPGRWMTVEFHNSANAVWNSIQEGLLRAGFMIADVRTLDKQQGTFKQVTSSAAVKQDLIISAYKPNDNLEERFRLQAGSVDGAWDFVRYHLGQLPVAVEKTGELETVAERQDFLLFDRMVAFHIQRGASVPLSAGEFYNGLRQRFVERDGMFFLPEQVPDYDSARLRLGRAAQLALFVKDEKSAIQWLRQRLEPSLGGEPTTFQDLQPVFLQQLHQAKHESLPELHILLEQNFLQDEQGRWYVPDPSKASDLEKVRLKSLLREFGTYVEGQGRLRQFRSEAVRAGFGECWQKREYATIIKVAERLPESVLHEDPDLLMYYDNATLRMK